MTLRVPMPAKRSKITTAFGERLTRARKERRWSQEELAARIGVHPHTVHRIETGQTSPTLERVEQLAAALKIPVAELLAIETEPRTSKWEEKVLATAVGIPPSRRALTLRLLRELSKKP